MAAVEGETFFIADFYHGICGCLLHDSFEAVVNGAYEKCWVFIGKAAARRNVSVGMNVENVARALTVIFLKPVAGLPGARVI